MWWKIRHYHSVSLHGGRLCTLSLEIAQFTDRESNSNEKNGYDNRKSKRNLFVWTKAREWIFVRECINTCKLQHHIWHIIFKRLSLKEHCNYNCATEQVCYVMLFFENVWYYTWMHWIGFKIESFGLYGSRLNYRKSCKCNIKFDVL